MRRLVSFRLSRVTSRSRSSFLWSRAWAVMSCTLARVEPKAAMLRSLISRLTRSSASTVRASTVPPPSSSESSELGAERITGITPGATVALSRGRDVVPAAIWT